jgi:hypothetical protein
VNSEQQYTGNRRNIFIGSILISIVICLGIAITFTLLGSAGGGDEGDKPAKLGLVPYIEPTRTLTITETPILPTPENIDGVQVGSVVQIFGTDGAGLKLRTNAGIQAEQKFVALDSEVYEVTDGPIVADEYIWWQLTSPYDLERSGWAVSQYLTVIQ